MEFVLTKVPCTTYGKLLLIAMLTGMPEADVLATLVQDGVDELIEKGYIDGAAYEEIFEPIMATD